MMVGALRVYTRSAPLIWCATGNFLPIAIFLVVRLPLCNSTYCVCWDPMNIDVMIELTC
jgi:hypothetical protein